MDILYSITAHESPECLIVFLNNIFYFNKALKISVIIHANSFMYKELSGKIPYKNVYLNNGYGTGEEWQIINTGKGGCLLKCSP